MRRLIPLLLVVPVVAALAITALVTPVLSSMALAQSGRSGDSPPAAIKGIPPAMLRLYAQAAATCPGLPWEVLAGIGTVESGNGTSDAAGVHSGANPAGAEGPMQFEPATFAAFDEPVPQGGADPPSPYDPADAVYAASRMLCADGAASSGRLPTAIWDYNHSEAYVRQVLEVASSYGFGRDDGSVGGVALDYALAQVGTPYRWGGEQEGVGFDCSGLVQAAYRAAGISIPRVAQDQFVAGPTVPAGQALVPGDLVFFGPLPGVVTHVGLVVDPTGVMVDAPHTGAAVRVEPFPTRVGAAWGGDLYLGATAPG